MLQFQQNINKLSEDELNAKFEQMLVRIFAMYFFISLCAWVCIKYKRLYVHVLVKV